MRRVHKGIVVLGAHGTKSKEGGSSSFLLNSHHVIDAGNLLLALEEKNVEINTVWITHSHLDHIVDLAFILDNYYEKRTQTLKIIALEETIESLSKHFFNDKIWPNFANIPLLNGQGMVLSYEVLTVGKRYQIDNVKTIEAFLSDHSVPSVGYIIRENNRSFLLSTDTYSLAHIVRMIKADTSIEGFMLECSFPTRLSHLAKLSKHLTAAHLFEGIEPLRNKNLKLYINHIKPVYEEEIRAEISALKKGWKIEMLEDGDKIKI